MIAARLRTPGALLACGLLVSPLAAQDAPGEAPISDNSFLIEEAYNQEPGVVQHISNFSPGGRRRRLGLFLYPGVAISAAAPIS